eukprot:753476-Hanusia_phi.AAC.11
MGKQWESDSGAMGTLFAGMFVGRHVLGAGEFRSNPTHASSPLSPSPCRSWCSCVIDFLAALIARLPDLPAPLRHAHHGSRTGSHLRALPASPDPPFNIHNERDIGTRLMLLQDPKGKCWSGRSIRGDCKPNPKFVHKLHDCAIFCMLSLSNDVSLLPHQASSEQLAGDPHRVRRWYPSMEGRFFAQSECCASSQLRATPDSHRESPRVLNSDLTGRQARGATLPVAETNGLARNTSGSTFISAAGDAGWVYASTQTLIGIPRSRRL